MFGFSASAYFLQIQAFSEIRGPVVSGIDLIEKI